MSGTEKGFSSNPPGTERAKLTHPERAKLTHPRFENGRSGQERQLGFHSDFRLFLDFIDSRKR